VVGIAVDVSFKCYRRGRRLIRLGDFRDPAVSVVEEGSVDTPIGGVVQFSQADPLKSEGDQTLIGLAGDGTTRSCEGMREFHRYGGMAPANSTAPNIPTTM
jgi:hypothetical protein